MRWGVGRRFICCLLYHETAIKLDPRYNKTKGINSCYQSCENGKDYHIIREKIDELYYLFKKHAGWHRPFMNPNK
jgi:hypothetical protein